MTNKEAIIYYTGREYTSPKFGTLKIIEYVNNTNITVQFSEGYVLKTRINDLILGSIKNLYWPSVYGVGYVGIGKYNTSYKRAYSVWAGMLQRCYDEGYQIKKPTYKGVTVCEEWHNFQNFAAWFEQNYVEGWELDKDIICPNCKIYSQETCCFVPRELNILFSKRQNKVAKNTGVIEKDNKYHPYIRVNCTTKLLGVCGTLEEAQNKYKKAKKEQALNMAEKWKGLVDNRVYEALINFKVYTR